MHSLPLDRGQPSLLIYNMLAQWPLDELPKASSRNGRIATAAVGSIGVLAL